MASKLSENIHIGMKVKIQRKRTKKILEGVVTEILDDKLFNENGIDVEIDNCYQGNVKNILNDNAEISPHDLLKKIGITVIKSKICTNRITICVDRRKAYSF